MYAYRIIQPLDGLHVQFDLPPEFAGCQEAEIIVLPVKPTMSNGHVVGTSPPTMKVRYFHGNPQGWEQWVLGMAGILSDDFPDDITDDDLGVDAPRKSLE